MEYNKFDKAWAPVSIYRVDPKNSGIVQVVLAADGGWLETTDLRPRVEGQEPDVTGDVARLADRIVREVLPNTDPATATFDQLAEEVLELHLALRGKHSDAPSMELIEVAGISLNALSLRPPAEIEAAFIDWQGRHGRAALAATPEPAKIEGPVQRNDQVTINTIWRVCQVDNSQRAVGGPQLLTLIDDLSGQEVQVLDEQVSVVSRPEPEPPAHTCGECARFVQGREHGICEYDKPIYVNPQDSACPMYAPKGRA
jgi:hypothetical protein